MKLTNRVLCLATVLAFWAVPGFGQSDGLDQAADDLSATGYPTPGASQRLNNELLFQGALQTYLWALPALNSGGPYSVLI